MGRKAKYRIRCNTENKWIYSEFLEDLPTECPNDSGHTINSNLTVLSEYESLNIEDFIEDGAIPYVVSDEEHTTTSNNYQEKVVLSLTSLPTSRYKVTFYSEFSQTNDKGGAEIQCTIGGEEIAQAGMEPEDKKVDYETFSGFTILELTGDVDIKINWRKSDHANQGTANCRRARIELTKVI
jgi:hypothetical protein